MVWSYIYQVIDNFLPGKAAVVPEVSYIRLISNDVHLLRVYQLLDRHPLDEHAICRATCLPKYRVDEYIHDLKARSAIRRQFFGRKYVLTPQGHADFGMIEDIVFSDL